jgi:hypothetical protein
MNLATVANRATVFIDIAALREIGNEGSESSCARENAPNSGQLTSTILTLPERVEKSA